MAEEYGKIRKSLMVGIADVIREKKKTTDLLTPEQMAIEISGIVTSDDLPNAEDVSFGSDNTLEYGKPIPTSFQPQSTKKASWGYRFTPNEAFAVYGLRGYAVDGAVEYFQLWDVDTKTLIAEVPAPSDASGLTDVTMSAPINVIPEKNYAVCVYSTGNAYTLSATPTFSSKLTANAWGISSAGRTVCPNYTSKAARVASADIILGPAIMESIVQEYKIQRKTLTDIADEILRINGATGTITPAQIITELSEVEVLPDAEGVNF